MKLRLSLLLVFICSLAVAQRTVTIDRSDDNAILFDDNNPMSFVRFIYNNQVLLPQIENIGMEQEVIAKLYKKKKAGGLERLYGRQSDMPLVDEYGEPITTDIDGVDYYIYPERDSTLFDLTNIDRIILEEDTVQNEATGESYVGLKWVHFYKQYFGKKYMRTLSLDFQDLIKFEGFKLIRKVEDEENKETFLNDLLGYTRSKVMDTTSSDTFNLHAHGIEILPYFFDLELAPRGSAFKLIYDREISYAYWNGDQTSDVALEKIVPFANIDSIKINADQQMELLNSFDEAFYRKEQSDVPLVDEYGDPLLDTLEDGSLAFAYPPADIYYKWIDEKDLDVWVMLDFHYNDPEFGFQNGIDVDQIYFTFHLDGIDKPIILYRVLARQDWIKERISFDIMDYVNPYSDLQSFFQLPCVELLMTYWRE